VRLLFVCGGNTCRSPLAAAVTRRLAAERGLRVVALSAGIAARSGSPASAEARAVAARRGCDLERHRARQVRPAQLAGCDGVLAMTRAHAAALRAMSPPAVQAPIRLLAHCAPWLGLDDIVDPWHADIAVYARTLELIETACAALVDELRPDDIGR
jgi:protein-tyrosine-phosphatase